MRALHLGFCVLLILVFLLVGCRSEDSPHTGQTERSESGDPPVGDVVQDEPDTPSVSEPEVDAGVEEAAAELALTPMESVAVDPASSEPVVLSLPEVGLTVTVSDPSAFEFPQALTVSMLTTPLPEPIPSYETTAMFDISADSQTRFDTPITVTMAVDEFEAHMADVMGMYVGWWNEESQMWVGVPTTLDVEAGTVSFQTSHLTVFGWFTSKLGYERRQIGQFEIIWDAEIFKTPNDLSDPDAWADKIVYTSEGDAAKLFPGEAWTTDANIPPFVRDTAAYLNHSLKLYKKAGFKTPKGTITVLLGGTDARNKAFDTIHIGDTNTGAAQLKQTCAHELFHAVQNEYLWDLGGMMFMNWWCESTAEYASNLVWAPAKPGRTVPPKYFSERLDSTNYEHEYESAYFISDLVGPGTQPERFKAFCALWTGTLAQHGVTDATDILYPLSVYLKSTGRDLSTSVNEHVYRVCLMPGSPMANRNGELSDRPSDGLVEGWATLPADEEETDPLTMTLKERHRAKVWGVRVRTVKSGESRPVELELTGKLSGNVTATAHVLPGGKRSDKALMPHGHFTAENRKVKLLLTQDDEVYVVVVNHGNASKNFTLNVRGANMGLLDHLHQTRDVWVSLDRDSGGSYMDQLQCEPIRWNGTSFSGSQNTTSIDKIDEEREVKHDRTTTVSGSVSIDAKTLTDLTIRQRYVKTTRNPSLVMVHETNYDLHVRDIPLGAHFRDNPDQINTSIAFHLLDANAESPEIVTATIHAKESDGSGEPLNLKEFMVDGVKVTVYFWKPVKEDD